MLRVTSPGFVGLILGYRCSAACGHCLYACSPRRREVLSDEDLGAAVDALCALTPRPSVHLAGGEPFLDLPGLLRATAAVADAGLAIDFIETSAAWVLDRADAVERLGALRDAGAPRLLVSATPWHAETIPLARVRTLLDAGEQVFGRGNAWAWTGTLLDELTALAGDGTLPFADYVQRIGATRARWNLLAAFPLTMAGRAPDGSGELVPRVPVEAIPRAPCRDELLHGGHGHLDPLGLHLPGYCAGIALGRADELPRLATDGLADADHPIVARLVDGGVHGLLRWAGETIGFTPDPAGYRGKCHLCQAIRGQLLAAGIGDRELAPRGFYEELGLLDG